MPVCAGPGHTWKREEHFVLLVLSFHLHMASGDGSQQVTRPREQAPLLAKHLHCPVLLLCFVFRDKIWCYSPDCPQPLCSPHASFSHVLGYKCGQHCAQERNILNDIYSFFKKDSPQFVEIPKIGLKWGTCGSRCLLQRLKPEFELRGLHGKEDWLRQLVFRPARGTVDLVHTNTYSLRLTWFYMETVFIKTHLNSFFSSSDFHNIMFRCLILS